MCKSITILLRKSIMETSEIKLLSDEKTQDQGVQITTIYVINEA